MRTRLLSMTVTLTMLAAGCPPVGWDKVDEDGDGYVNAEDCDDRDASRNPGATEVCDGVDNNCDTQIDEGSPPDAPVWYLDVDEDGFGDAAAPLAACEQPAGATDDATDCDDTSAFIFPGAPEQCFDGVDEDCDGAVSGCDGSLLSSEAILVGASVGDRLGSALAGRGDLDGDGRPDLALGSTEADLGGNDSGAAWLLLGAVSGQVSMAEATVALYGASGDKAGEQVSLGGDVDGDGLDDFTVGASRSDLSGLSNSGTAWLLYGPASASGALADVADAGVYGDVAGGYAGEAVALVSDVDGDGLDELLLGASKASGDEAGSGLVYLVAGPVSGTGTVSALATATLAGVSASDAVGTDLLDGADLDGDGLGDLVIGAAKAAGTGPESGAVYVVFGPVSGALSLADADAALYGASPGDQAGVSAAAGDTDGDGVLDLLMGAPFDDTATSDAGAAPLFLGPIRGVKSADEADALLMGVKAGDRAGFAVALPGDYDGDGVGDLWVGADQTDEGGSSAGSAVMFFGPVSGLVSLDGAAMRLAGPELGIHAGYVVAPLGDRDGDGFGDVGVGAYKANDGGIESGTIYLLNGGRSL